MTLATGYNASLDRVCVWDPNANPSYYHRFAYFSSTYSCYYYYFSEYDPTLNYFMGTIYRQYWL